jgi:hypothetical protein
VLTNVDEPSPTRRVRRVEARRDLYDALVVDDLVGSATRVAFARVGHIRTILGCPPEDLRLPDDADKFVLDDKYLHIDISVHWVRAWQKERVGPCSNGGV